jgi:release factor glutamine methyltransferase
MPSLHDRLAHAGQALVGAGIAAEEAARDAELLARHLLGWDRAAMLSRRRDPAPSRLDERYDAFISRRAAREPVAYIAGCQEFWGLELEVSPDVLIPRPETELIVEEALAAVRGSPNRIVDVGTGSGCLAIALACAVPSAQVVGTDLSLPALDVARRNAARHGVSGRVTFVQADLLDGLDARADLIVANLPYVPSREADLLQPEVRQYEPGAALFGGEDGLAVIRRLFSSAAGHLAGDGLLVVEFGFGQEGLLRTSAAGAGWQVMRIREDLQSIPRVAVVRR